MRQVHLLEPQYPAALKDLVNPPAVLYVDGVLKALEERPVLAVVGSRDCSIMAEAWMRRHLAEVSRFALIVSGGAAGVDDCAHRIALAAGEPTVVVLPSGLKNPYPAHWRDANEEVRAKGGAFVSEYEPEQMIRRSHFEKRNRLLAAFADVVLVVEAQLKSGTAITARHAQELGRAVAVVPWFPGDPRGELGLELLTQSAALPVRNAADLLSALSREACARHTRSLRSSVPNSPNQEDASD
ncbi:MAG: DNA-protecting protein DprA [Bdellovibrionaceae bacterium]|nr:DNA-protecting protein DprA [Pseudobdellovibrionaceae bacterium]